MARFESNQKRVLIFLGTLILIYIVTEIWFVTAFINSATLNEDLEKLYKFGDLAVALAAFSLTVNFAIFAVRKYHVIKESFTRYSYIASCCFALYWFVWALTSYFNATTYYVFALITLITLPIFKRFSIKDSNYAVVAFLFMSIVIFTIARHAISYYKYDYYASDSYDAVLCHAASEFYKDEYYLPWSNESNFLKIEEFQLESVMFSILTCKNVERRKQIAQDNNFKAHLYKRFLHEAKLDKIVSKYSEIRREMPKAFEIHAAYRARPEDKTIFGAANKLRNEGYTKKEITDFFSMIGIRINLSYLYLNVDVEQAFKTDESVFSYMIQELTQDVSVETNVKLNIPFMASKDKFKRSIIEQTFDNKYAAFQKDFDFKHLRLSRHVDEDARNQYLIGAPKELVLNLSVITIILSLFSLLFLLIEIFVGKFKKLQVFVNPLSLTIASLICIVKYVPTPHADLLDTRPDSTSILKVHYFVYPTLKDTFTRIGIHPWFDTYRDKPDSQELERSLEQSMDRRYYLTPINSSAIKKIQLLYFISEHYEFDKSYKSKLSQIEDFYVKNGDKEKRLYIKSIREMLY